MEYKISGDTLTAIADSIRAKTGGTERYKPPEMASAISGINPDGIEHYTGDYDVTPLVTSQVLATRDKLMDDNVRVDMIPTREENNAAGGVTFIVGG